VRPSRLVGLASILVDVSLAVPALPPRGGDVLARALGRAPGGGINALVAAARLGLAAVYAGRHGSGPNGRLIREALRREGIGLMLPRTVGSDSGWCLALVEPDGERTFITAPGAEAVQDERALARVVPGHGDMVYVSGYDLAYPNAGAAVAAWVSRLPPAEAGGPWVALDPGPLAGELPADRLRATLARIDLLSLSAGEFPLFADAGARTPHVVVRRGREGAELIRPGRAPLRVPAVAPPGPVVDTNGAGDTHLGAVLAGRAAGLGWAGSLTLGNRAAAFSITRIGAASGPTAAELGWSPA